MGHVFSESGFKVDGGRKLLGMYEIIGMFNSVDEWEVGFNRCIPASQPPSLLLRVLLTYYNSIRKPSPNVSHQYIESVLSLGLLTPHWTGWVY